MIWQTAISPDNLSRLHIKPLSNDDDNDGRG
jgi:hypothetical protein